MIQTAQTLARHLGDSVERVRSGKEVVGDQGPVVDRLEPHRVIAARVDHTWHARAAGVPRVIYASSNHAVGFQPIDHGSLVPDYLFPRPDSLYGVSKVASESLGSLYHDRYGLDVLCLRIGSYRERPSNIRELWSWLSPGDCVRLVEAAMTTARPGFRVVWGVSANRRAVVTLAEARAIGYFPLDDAEVFADEIMANSDDGGRDEPPRLGGSFASPST